MDSTTEVDYLLKRFARIRQIAEGNGYDEIAEQVNMAFSYHQNIRAAQESAPADMERALEWFDSEVQSYIDQSCLFGGGADPDVVSAKRHAKTIRAALKRSTENERLRKALEHYKRMDDAAYRMQWGFRAVAGDDEDVDGVAHKALSDTAPPSGELTRSDDVLNNQENVNI